MPRPSAILTTLILSFPLAQARAGLYLEYRITPAGTPAESCVSKTFLEPEKVAMIYECPGAKSGNISRPPRAHRTVFDAKAGTLHQIIDARKTYSTVDRKKMQEQQAQSESRRLRDSGFSGQFQALIRSLPPEGKRQFEDLARENPVLMSQVEKTQDGGTLRVGDWICRSFVTLMNGKKTRERCVVPPSRLGLELKPYLDIVEKFADFNGNPSQKTSLFGSEGMVVRSTHSTAAGTSESVLVRARNQPLDASAFAIPSGYAKTDSAAPAPAPAPAKP